MFVDEGRTIAVELELALRPFATGRLAAITVTGRAPDGTLHTTTASLEVDIRAGDRVVDRDAQRDVVLVQTDAGRAEARAQADRGATPAAVAILRRLAARIDATVGFVRNDGSLLAELREQLDDEIASYEQASTDAERVHQRKASTAYTAASPTYARARGQIAAVPAQLTGLAGPLAGTVYQLFAETAIGRSSTSDLVVHSGMLSRSHARVLLVGPDWILHDLGTSNGSFVNGERVTARKLHDGDVLKLGDAVFKFNLTK